MIELSAETLKKLEKVKKLQIEVLTDVNEAMIKLEESEDYKKKHNELVALRLHIKNNLCDCNRLFDYVKKTVIGGK